MYNSYSSHDWLEPSTGSNPSDYGLLPQGEASEIPTQLRPRQPYPTQGPFTTRPHITLPQPPYNKYSEAQQSQQRTIMSSHKDWNSGDEETEEKEMARSRTLRERYASRRLDNMPTLVFEKRVEGSGRLPRRQQQEVEEECEDEDKGDEGGRGDLSDREILTLPPQPNLVKGKPFSPRRDISYGYSPFKRKREGQESPEMRRASAPILRQGVFPQALILGRAAADGFNRVMMQGSRGSWGVEGLGIRDRTAPSSEKLHLGSQSQVHALGPFERSYDQPWEREGPGQQPQSLGQPQGLGFDGLGLSISQPQCQLLSGQQPQSMNQGPSFVWEPEAAAFGSLLNFPSVSHVESRRSSIAQPCEASSVAVRGRASSGSLPVGFPDGSGRPPNLLASSLQPHTFLASQLLGGSNNHDAKKDEWCSPAVARQLTRHLPTLGCPSNLHDARTSEVTTENLRVRLVPEPTNNPWQTLPGFGDENESGDEGDGDIALRISPNERRRRLLDQQPFMPSFDQDVYRQIERRGNLAATLTSAHRNNSPQNDHMGQRRAPMAESRVKGTKEQEESKQRPRHIRLNRTRFGVENDAEYKSGEFLDSQDRSFCVRQAGKGEHEATGARKQPEGSEAWLTMRTSRKPANFSGEEDGGDEDDEDDEGGVRLGQVLQGSAGHRQKQSSEAQLSVHTAQRPERETSSTCPRRSSSVSAQSRDLRSPEPIGIPQQSRQRQRRLPRFMQPTQASRRRFLSHSSAGVNTSRRSPRQSFLRRASRGLSRGGPSGSHINRAHDRLLSACRPTNLSAPFPTARQSPVPGNGKWSGPPHRPPCENVMHHFARTAIDAQSSARETPALLQVATAPMRGHSSTDGIGNRSGGGRCGAHIPSSNSEQAAAINHNHAPQKPKCRGHRDRSASAAMTGRGLDARSGDDSPLNTARYALGYHPMRHRESSRPAF